MALEHYLVVGAILFCLGILAVATRRNAISILMGVELILNAANLNLVAFARFTDSGLEGQVFAVFVIVLAAAEAAVALAIVLNIYRNYQMVNIDRLDSLSG
ncbi:MAG: NADH-quinone oxidoreductase subunit NuoK [Gemmatimonadetes bacterium]|nr:NADH-quinone oxidoreductase subunit NuoK [Gemmatimonadota bacterium]MDE3256711.1 NADH-quinone oxidoreductase subunit NuoK [Gemmatimonadota bacterium]